MACLLPSSSNINGSSSPTLLFFSLLLLLLPSQTLTLCGTKCGALDVRYPFGTGFGCGAPRFNPSISCTSTSSSSNDSSQEALILTTRSGATYTITSVSYDTSTLTISPPMLSTCSAMHDSPPPLALDWDSPFRLGPSLLALLACSPSASPLPFCDASTAALRLCAALNACPALPSLGLPLFAPPDTCCAYSAAALGPRGALDVRALGCRAYTGVLSFGTVPTDPGTWEYGVALAYGPEGVAEADPVAEVCRACERSGGACGYAPPGNYFVCACSSGVNTSTDCAYGRDEGLRDDYWRSAGGEARSVRVKVSLMLMVPLLGFLWMVMNGKRI